MTPAQKNDVILERIGDYEGTDTEALRERLVSLWKAAHPEAAKEVSSYLHPLVQIDGPKDRIHTDYRMNADKSVDQVWSNDVYIVNVRFWIREQVFYTKPGCMIQLGIASIDGSARHDFRDMQAIKNQIAGPECEAFELYPRSSRLLDPSNYFTLFCFPDIKTIKFGVDGPRDVRTQNEALAPQREFPEE